MQFFSKLQLVKPQQSAIAGGTFLMLSSGIHLGYGFFHWRDVNVAWNEKMSDSFVAFAVVAYFIGNIVGYSIAPLSMKNFSKKLVYVSE